MTQVSGDRGFSASFWGLKAHTLNISKKMDYTDVSTFTDLVPQKVLVSCEVRAEARFWLSDKLLREAPGFMLANAWDTINGLSTRSLGPGSLCEYCGTVWTPGTLICANCGAPTNPRVGILETQGLGLLERISIQEDYHHGGLYELCLDLVLPSEGEIPRSLALTYPGSWVCPYCGLYVQGEFGNCPGCGGQRLPINKLAQLERVCVYCGTRVLGGFACPKCRGRIKNRSC